MNSVKYEIYVGKMTRKEAEKSIRDLMGLYKTNLKRIIKIKKILNKC